jgi:hypothetical protein
MKNDKRPNIPRRQSPEQMKKKKSHTVSAARNFFSKKCNLIPSHLCYNSMCYTMTNAKFIRGGPCNDGTVIRMGNEPVLVLKEETWTNGIAPHANIFGGPEKLGNVPFIPLDCQDAPLWPAQ